MLIVLCAAYDLATGIAQLIAPHAGSVDFHIYYAASRALAQGRSPYAVPPPCCFSAAAMRGYTYPPLFAFLFIPLTHVPVDDAGRIWLLINYASLLGVLVMRESGSKAAIRDSRMACPGHAGEWGNRRRHVWHPGGPRDPAPGSRLRLERRQRSRACCRWTRAGVRGLPQDLAGLDCPGHPAAPS